MLGGYPAWLVYGDDLAGVRGLWRRVGHLRQGIGRLRVDEWRRG